MAKQLKKYARSSRPGPDYKYPWDQWLDGSTWQLVQGEDFDCSVLTITTTLRDVARRRGIQISVFRENETTIVVTPRI